MSVSRYVSSAVQTLPHLTRTLKLIARATPGWTSFWITLLLIQGFLPAAIVYLTRPIVNGIVQGGPILVPAALLAAALLLAEVLRGVTHWISTVQAALVQDHVTSLIQDKSIQADLAFYESPDFYDHLHRARAEAGYRPIALLESLGNLLRNSITLIAMLIVISAFGIWLPIALLASTMPVLGVVLHQANRRHEFHRRTTSLNRRSRYFDWLLTEGEAAPELRLFGLGGYFKRIYQDLRSQINGESITLARRSAIAQILAAVFALVVTGAAMVWMVLRTRSGQMSIGDLALFYQAFQSGLNLSRGLLENFGQLYQNSLFLGNLFEFLALEPKLVSPVKPVAVPERLREGIRFAGVTFRYPGTGKVAIEDFDLTIPAGHLVALVGPNGAGKSTLVKLLCRFYDPDSGSITIDGTDLRHFSVEELRRMMTVLFQQPVHYNATVADNIRFGDVSANGSVQAAAVQAGADAFIERLPERYNNLLGAWFEKGAELSVGEWQRVALARAFLRKAPVILLDEPTSSMDPWAEAGWLARFRELAKGRTSILITHRFTTAMLADEIHVMDEGRIVESGSHSDLIGRTGRYAEWWKMQR
jgi:ATP-binding cassette subfamily B protein